jgi:UDP-N-acetylmuramoylalanine--D-glutamate ligase
MNDPHLPHASTPRPEPGRHAGARVGVVGLGATGLSAIRYLSRHGAAVRAWDTRGEAPAAQAVREEFPGLPVALGAIDERALADCDWVLLSPGVPRELPAVVNAIGRGVPVLGDVELFVRDRGSVLPDALLMAVTGTNGKSTVTEMAGSIARGASLRAVVAGNIGLPVLDLLVDSEQRALAGEPLPQAVVLELSSFQLESTVALDADAAAMLNLSEDHLDRHGSLAAYTAAKARIFEGARAQVLNRDDTASMAMRRAGCGLRTFGTGEPAGDAEFGLRRHDGEPWLTRGTRLLMPQAALPLPGLHNAANALAAVALADAAGVDVSAAPAALAGFGGLPHRVQLIAEIDGVAFYDDSKGTNVGATVAALSGFPRPLVLIAGGDGKGQDFSPLARAMGEAVRAVVLIGADAARIDAALAASGVSRERAASLEEAVARARALARPGDAVLLSPACASYDMFRNYVHRAQVFLRAVTALRGGPSAPRLEAPRAARRGR